MSPQKPKIGSNSKSEIGYPYSILSDDHHTDQAGRL